TSKEQLTFSVYKLVKTLNRPEVYAVVATVIIEQISKLYSDIAVYDTQLSLYNLLICSIITVAIPA
ncbi:MAG: hypothetical protein ACKO90_28995, partial [Microcystis panniformis]